MANNRQNSKLSRRWSRLWDTVASTLRDYVVNVRWKGEERTADVPRGRTSLTMGGR